MTASALPSAGSGPPAVISLDPWSRRCSGSPTATSTSTISSSSCHLWIRHCHQTIRGSNSKAQQEGGTERAPMEAEAKRIGPAQSGEGCRQCGSRVGGSSMGLDVSGCGCIDSKAPVDGSATSIPCAPCNGTTLPCPVHYARAASPDNSKGPVMAPPAAAYGLSDLWRPGHFCLSAP